MNLLSSIINLLATAGTLPNETVERARQIVFLVLIILMGVVALASIVLVMLQPGNSQGIDALGGSSETFYGKNKGKSTEAKLKLWTLICLILLAVLSIAFFILQIDAIWGAK
ncbi:MAG: preprotein translocase subunit SecG [Clostridia bacterium]|nr:preprotein translocase subunit SecG [Clostridia bacterium]